MTTKEKMCKIIKKTVCKVTKLGNFSYNFEESYSFTKCRIIKNTFNLKKIFFN